MRRPYIYQAKKGSHKLVHCSIGSLLGCIDSSSLPKKERKERCGYMFLSGLCDAI